MTDDSSYSHDSSIAKTSTTSDGESTTSSSGLGCNPFGIPFGDQKSLVRAVQGYATSQGFVLPVKRSRIVSVVLHCDRAGPYRHAKKKKPLRRRKTGSKRCGCLYQVEGTLDKASNRWFARLIHGHHNHDLDDLVAHPFHRRQALTPTVRTDIERMLDAGITPRQILSSLQTKYVNIPFTKRDIYNVRHRQRKDKRHGQPAIQALIQYYKDKDDWICTYDIDESNKIRSIFITHATCVHLSQNFDTVFLLDCTYKTNRLGMPLLVVVGITALNTTFIAGYVFLSEENFTTYSWALNTFKAWVNVNPCVLVTDREMALINAIDNVYPGAKHLLCLWHIAKNILAKTKKFFVGANEFNNFYQLVTTSFYAKTTEDFMTQWNVLSVLYLDHPAFRYVSETWFQHRQKFVVAWTKQHCHLGAQVTSRVESVHSAIKKYVQSSSLDLLEVVSKIGLLLSSQHIEYTTEVARQRITRMHHLHSHIFRDIEKKVSLFALDKVSFLMSSKFMGVYN